MHLVKWNNNPVMTKLHLHGNPMAMSIAPVMSVIVTFIPVSTPCHINFLQVC